MSQTPTYDQLRGERINPVSEPDSRQQGDHCGKHHLRDDLTAVAARDRSLSPDADLTNDWSGLGTGGHRDRRGKHRPRTDTPTTAAVRAQSPRRTADLGTDWSWFGQGEPDHTTPRNVVAFMNSPTLIDRTRALLTVLTELDIRPGNRVLIMLPEGPGFTESFAAVFYRDAVPLPVNPLLSATELTAAATQTHARLVLATPEQLPALTEINTTPPILIHGPHGPWAATLPLH